MHVPLGVILLGLQPAAAKESENSHAMGRSKFLSLDLWLEMVLRDRSV